MISRFPGLPALLLAAGLAMPAASQAGEASPITTELSYVAESARVVGGGLQKGTTNHAAGTLDVTLDGEALGWWPGGMVFIEFIVDHGPDPSRHAGDIQALSNIADGNRTRLQQFWIEQRLGDAASILLGTHDLNSEFYVSDYAGLFTNSSFGIGPEISSVGASLWPEAGLAARLLVQPHEHVSLRLAGYDGDPATRQLKGAEGYLGIFEAALEYDTAAFKLGAWKHSRYAAADGSQGIAGGYGLADIQLADWDEGNLGVFFQYGAVQSKKANDIRSYLGLGLHVGGLIPGRPDDEFGLAMARASLADAYRQANGALANETAVELTYRIALGEHLALQPAFQWIQHPSGDPNLSSARVLLLRGEFSL